MRTSSDLLSFAFAILTILTTLISSVQSVLPEGVHVRRWDNGARNKPRGRPIPVPVAITGAGPHPVPIAVAGTGPIPVPIAVSGTGPTPILTNTYPSPASGTCVASGVGTASGTGCINYPGNGSTLASTLGYTRTCVPVTLTETISIPYTITATITVGVVGNNTTRRFYPSGASTGLMPSRTGYWINTQKWTYGSPIIDPPSTAVEES